jgi:hypothetical protein
MSRLCSIPPNISHKACCRIRLWGRAGSIVMARLFLWSQVMNLIAYLVPLCPIIRVSDEIAACRLGWTTYFSADPFGRPAGLSGGWASAALCCFAESRTPCNSCNDSFNTFILRTMWTCRFRKHRRAPGMGHTRRDWSGSGSCPAVTECDGRRCPGCLVVARSSLAASRRAVGAAGELRAWP